MVNSMHEISTLISFFFSMIDGHEYSLDSLVFFQDFLCVCSVYHLYCSFIKICWEQQIRSRKFQVDFWGFLVKFGVVLNWYTFVLSYGFYLFFQNQDMIVHGQKLGMELILFYQ
eukprot:TRINITY_DN4017_c4_g1_i1.p3 TRINITY_DN4017_c4_g1~~TRINITY_DN4017_c4_g1_i1.p3  ORF type:complete len:114 (-),score=2.86 TRINITY_DN4017_c4_g1_i1:47-388(-)